LMNKNVVMIFPQFYSPMLLCHSFQKRCSRISASTPDARRQEPHPAGRISGRAMPIATGKFGAVAWAAVSPAGLRFSSLPFRQASAAAVALVEQPV
jgi:hypothetical protein